MSEPRKEIKVALPLSMIERLNHEARKKGISRQDLIRERIANPSQSKPGNVRFDRHSYARAVEAAAKATPGIPRTQLEWTVSTVINSIAS